MGKKKADTEINGSAATSESSSSKAKSKQNKQPDTVAGSSLTISRNKHTRMHRLPESLFVHFLLTLTRLHLSFSRTMAPTTP